MPPWIPFRSIFLQTFLSEGSTQIYSLPKLNHLICWRSRQLEAGFQALCVWHTFPSTITLPLEELLILIYFGTFSGAPFTTHTSLSDWDLSYCPDEINYVNMLRNQNWWWHLACVCFQDAPVLKTDISCHGICFCREDCWHAPRCLSLFLLRAGDVCVACRALQPRLQNLLEPMGGMDLEMEIPCLKTYLFLWKRKGDSGRRLMYVTTPGTLHYYSILLVTFYYQTSLKLWWERTFRWRSLNMKIMLLIYVYEYAFGFSLILLWWVNREGTFLCLYLCPH